MAEMKIYTKEGCPFCEKAINHYTEQGIEFEEINTSKDEEARQYAIEEYGAERVPVIVKNGVLEQTGFGGGG
ncbi:MAG: glutaredoxin family protein [Halanaerobium sp.]